MRERAFVEERVQVSLLGALFFQFLHMKIAGIFGKSFAVLLLL